MLTVIPTAILGKLGESVTEGKEDDGLRLVVLNGGGSSTSGWIAPGKAMPKTKQTETLSAWEAKGEAVSAAHQVIALGLQGASRKSVLIYGMKIHVRNCKPALKGPYIREIGGGDAPSRFLLVDLDDPHPSAQPWNGPNSSIPHSKVEPEDFPFFVSEKDLEYFEVSVKAEKRYCEWEGEIFWAVDGKKGSTKVDNEGRPFRLSGTSAKTGEFTYMEDYGASDEWG
ncbi:hypothetical protein [Streptomyces spiralis]